MQKEDIKWFVMRDLKRPNAKTPAYRQLDEAGFEIFTPMKWRISTVGGKRVRKYLPVLPDLVFVHSTYTALSPVVNKTPTLQFRFLRGGAYCEPMVVREEEMNRFILAVEQTKNPIYYGCEELTPDMVGRRVRIVGGLLDGYEGRLLKKRGTRKKRLIVGVENVMMAAVEVVPEYIEFLD